MPGSVEGFLTDLKDQLGILYVYGGASPQVGFDCSGLEQYCAELQGVPIPRTTEGMYAAAIAKTSNLEAIWISPNYQQVQPTSVALAHALPGDILSFNVPSDTNAQPAHTGVYLGDGQMIQAPETFVSPGVRGRVEISPVPNDFDILLMGVLRITGFDPVPAPEPPGPIPTIEGDTDMAANDPISGGEWVTDSTGALFAFDGAPFLGNLVDHPEYHAGGTNDPCVGVAFWHGNGTDANGNGYALFTRPVGSGQPNAYRFPRDGSLVPKS